MKRLWLAFIVVNVISFAVLGWIGSRIYQSAPNFPSAVVLADGKTFLVRSDFEQGQNVWQAMGGMELGSIWGHGSYVAPDWTADWLHRECVYILNRWANAENSKSFRELDTEKQAQLQSRLQTLIRKNTLDESTGKLLLDPVRAEAFEENQKYYASLFTNGNVGFAIPQGAQTDPAKLRSLSAFFFWTSWAASTNRPGLEISYTSNWPHEPLVGNHPSGETVVWTGVSIIMLLAGIGGMVWF